jgi:unsaturated rhamnogalacturonyl hydrolase
MANNRRLTAARLRRLALRCWQSAGLWRTGLFLALVVAIGIIGYPKYWELRRQWARRSMAGSIPEPALFELVYARSRVWVRSPPHQPKEPADATLWNAIRRRFKTQQSPTMPGALLAQAVIEADRLSPNPESATAVEAWLAPWIGPTGKWRFAPLEVDAAGAGRVLLELYRNTGSERWRQAAHEMADWYLTRARGEPTLRYRQNDPRALHFVDALGPLCPFLADYGVEMNRADALELALRQLDAYQDYGMQLATGLPYHAYIPEGDSAVPGGAAGWGRGVGWYALGLADTLASLPKDHSARPRLTQRARDLARSLARWELPDGGWSVLLPAVRRYDASATALLGYFLEKGMALGVLPPECRGMTDRALAAMAEKTRADGSVDFAQGAAYGLNEASRVMDRSVFAQGAALRWLALRRQKAAVQSATSGSVPTG